VVVGDDVALVVVDEARAGRALTGLDEYDAGGDALVDVADRFRAAGPRARLIRGRGGRGGRRGRRGLRRRVVVDDACESERTDDERHRERTAEEHDE